MSDKSRNRKGQPGAKTDKPYKGNKNTKGESKDPKKPFPEPQSQNERRQVSKPVAAPVKVEEPPANMTVTFNSNRDPDEVLQISDGPTKYSKREIISNWTKYELPVDNYDLVEESSHGADFEELLRMPSSRGGHFQFKHEKTWTSSKKPSQYSDLFSLDLNYISSALLCVPFYERNRLDQSVFTADQVTRMINTANKNMAKFKKNLPIEKEDKEISKNLLKKLTGKDTKCKTLQIENVNSEELLSDDEIIEDVKIKLSIEPLKLESKTLEKKSEVRAKKELEVPVKKMENIAVEENDDQLDEILGMINTESDLLQENNSVPKSPEILTSPAQALNPTISDDLDLDKWLDDYLDSET